MRLIAALATVATIIGCAQAEAYTDPDSDLYVNVDSDVASDLYPDADPDVYINDHSNYLEGLSFGHDNPGSGKTSHIVEIYHASGPGADKPDQSLTCQSNHEQIQAEIGSAYPEYGCKLQQTEETGDVIVCSCKSGDCGSVVLQGCYMYMYDTELEL